MFFIKYFMFLTKNIKFYTNTWTSKQAELETMTSRLDAAYEFVKGLADDGFRKFKKGEWIGVVRAKTM